MTFIPQYVCILILLLLPPPSITPLSKPNQTRLNLRQRFLRLLHFLFIFNLSFTLNHYLRLHHHWLLQPGYQIYWCPFLALPYPLPPRPNRGAAVIGCRSICSISNIHRCHCTAHHLPCHQLGKEEEEESAVESSTWWDLNSTSLEIWCMGVPTRPSIQTTMLSLLQTMLSSLLLRLAVTRSSHLLTNLPPLTQSRRPPLLNCLLNVVILSELIISQCIHVKMVAIMQCPYDGSDTLQNSKDHEPHSLREKHIFRKNIVEKVFFPNKTSFFATKANLS